MTVPAVRTTFLRQARQRRTSVRASNRKFFKVFRVVQKCQGLNCEDYPQDALLTTRYAACVATISRPIPTCDFDDESGRWSGFAG
jgi:hypothetical protein